MLGCQVIDKSLFLVLVRYPSLSLSLSLQDKKGKPLGVYFDPGAPPEWGPKSPTHTQYLNNYTAVAKFCSWNSVRQGYVWNVSPVCFCVISVL